MPTPFMCHDCDSPTMNKCGICDNCVEPTTADEYNKEFALKEDQETINEDEVEMRLQQEEIAYLEGEKNPYRAILVMEATCDEMTKDLKWATDEIDRLRGGLHMCKELAMLRDNYGMIESVAEEHLEKSNKK